MLKTKLNSGSPFNSAHGKTLDSFAGRIIRCKDSIATIVGDTYRDDGGSAETHGNLYKIYLNRQ